MNPEDADAIRHARNLGCSVKLVDEKVAELADVLDEFRGLVAQLKSQVDFLGKAIGPVEMVPDPKNPARMVPRNSLLET